MPSLRDVAAVHNVGQTDPYRLAASRIYVGISAWTEPTLIESGRFYPADAKTAEKRLRYYASEFPIVEVDSTFYAPPNERIAQIWTDRTPGGFIFDVKAYRLLTHHPTPPSSLWRELRDELSPELRAKPTIYAADLSWELLESALDRYMAGIGPLVDAGRLGVVLFQLPRYVYPSRRSYGYLEWLASRLGDVQAAVEFRQSRWMDDDHRVSTLDFLGKNRLAYVSVDEPQGFPSSIPPIAAATANVAVVRFHGRNRDRWQARTTRAADRFAYDYALEELSEWVPRIESLHHRERPVHILMNNCYSDYAVRAARTLSAQLMSRQRASGSETARSDPTG